MATHGSIEMETVGFKTKMRFGESTTRDVRYSEVKYDPLKEFQQILVTAHVLQANAPYWARKVGYAV